MELSEVPIIKDAGQVHANFSEALERLQFQRFLKTDSEIEHTVADDLQNVYIQVSLRTMGKTV